MDLKNFLEGRRQMTRMKELVIALLVFMLSCLLALGADSSDNDKWEFEFTPYFWLSSIDADSTVQGQTASVDLSFGDILDNFDVFGLMGRFEAWYGGEVGFIFDGTYVDMDSKEGAVNVPGTPIGVDINMKQSIVDLGVGYRAFETPLARGEGSSVGSGPPTLYFDVIGGLRYNYMDQEQSLQIIIPGIGQPSLSGNEDWLEPFIGGRIGVHITDKFGAVVRGNVGGFGLGNASDLSWNFVGGIGYRPWQLVSFKLAYRIYGLDYEKGTGPNRFGFDGTLYGPVLGVTFHF